jgi:hypothetical protein
MQRHSNDRQNTATLTSTPAGLRPSPHTETPRHPSIAPERGPMKLIPWEEIWRSLQAARIRGHGEMIEVFYDTLFKEAVFDDDGAWSQDRSRQN